MTALTPRKPVPALEVPTLAGETWNLAERKPENFTMIVFYRGLHCPICSNYMRDLDRKLGDFEALGVEVVAISTDDQERSRQTQESWGLENVTIGYDIGIEKAREWGLYISSSRNLYAALTGSMPFARPHFSEILKALQFIIEKDYPGRGEA